MPLSTTDLSELAGLNAGRNPEWATEQTAVIVDGVFPTVAPRLTTAGIDVSGSTLALVAVDLHQTPGCPSITLATTGSTWSGTFAATVDAVAYSTSGNTTQQEVYLALLDLFNVEDDEADHLAEANYDTDGTTILSLRVFRRPDHAVPVASSTTNMADTSSEGTFAHVRVWALPTNATRWRCITVEHYELTQNFCELFRVSCIDRLYVQVVSSDGKLRWNVAPCLAEEA